MKSTSAHVLKHYIARWGEPSRAAEFHRDDRSVRIAKWSADRTGEGVAIYATVGLSDDPLGMKSSAHRVEVLIGLHPEEDRIARPMGVAALSSRPEDPYFLHGHTIRLPEPLWPGTEMCGFVVTEPRNVIIPDLRVHDLHVNFLHLIAVFPEELEFKKATSVEELLATWEARGFPFWDPLREPCVPSGRPAN